MEIKTADTISTSICISNRNHNHATTLGSTLGHLLNFHPENRSRAYLTSYRHISFYLSCDVAKMGNENGKLFLIKCILHQIRSLTAKVCARVGGDAGDCGELAACATLRSCATPGILTREWDKRDQKYQFKFQITNLSLALVEIVCCVAAAVDGGYRWWCMSPSGPNVYRGIFHTDLLWLIFMTYIWAWHRHATPGEELHCLVYSDSAKVFENSYNSVSI